MSELNALEIQYEKLGDEIEKLKSGLFYSQNIYYIRDLWTPGKKEMAILFNKDKQVMFMSDANNFNIADISWTEVDSPINIAFPLAHKVKYKFKKIEWKDIKDWWLAFASVEELDWHSLISKHAFKFKLNKDTYCFISENVWPIPSIMTNHYSECTNGTLKYNWYELISVD